MVFPKVGLLAALSTLPDFRKARGLRHALSAMLASVICGVLSGHCGVKQIVQWLHAQPAEFWHLLGYQRTPPRETWFRQVLASLDPEQWEAVVVEWLGGEVTAGAASEMATASSPSTSKLEVVSVDGKTLRGTISVHAKALHLLTVWTHANGLVLTQRPVGNTNEPTAAVALFRDMLLTGKLVVGDAAFCQREVCQTIRDRGGHYLVWVKDNQPTLLKDARSVFVDPAGFSPLPQTAS
jgi:DDE_Tnp_1-associated/Transposase DDE domain